MAMSPSTAASAAASAPGILLGLDVGGTKCCVLAGTAAGEVVDRVEWRSQAERGPDPMVRELLEQTARLADRRGPVQAIGVSIGGPLDAASGVVHSPPNLPGWEGIEIRRILEGRFRVPVAVEHDAAACALAEFEWGRQRQPCRLVYLTCATGFGAGMVFDAKPYYGVFGRSPEIGHVLLDPDGPEAFGLQGCAEAFCSARSLGRIAVWKYPQRWTQPPEPRQIQSLAAAGDPDAQAIIDLNARMTGRVCALIADFLHLDLIVLGSLSLYLGASWVEAVRRECRRLALPEAAAHCTIDSPRLGNRLQDLSALAAAVRALGASTPTTGS